MRGTDQRQSYVFNYISPEQRVRSDHALRPIRTMVDKIPKQLSPLGFRESGAELDFAAAC